MKDHHYFVYITTNPKRTVLYVGVTNNLKRRLEEHLADNNGPKETFAGKYFCYNLVYYEYFPQVESAIAREKEIKGWKRTKKEMLIKQKNPGLRFLNAEI